MTYRHIWYSSNQISANTENNRNKIDESSKNDPDHNFNNPYFSVKES
ncbi:MAG TPA: hypothetical protein VEP89_03335 [Draconibacterium sp.]|nr:hypothetical protein [Draconibacterium sp.]